MSNVFDSDTSLNDITEGLDQNTESSEGSRQSSSSKSSSSASRTHQEALAPQEKVAAYYNGFQSKRRYV